MINKVLSILAIVALCALFAFCLVKGADRAEAVECYKWQDQAQQYTGFYLLQWQADQCKAQGIDIDAPIK